MNDLALLKDVDKAEAALMQLPQAQAPVEHSFGPGLYIRTVFLPAGTIAIGHEQLFPHMNVMLTGRVQMIDCKGNLVEVVAPCSFIGAPGRKVGRILEDTIWQNIYATTETDVDKLEAHFIKKSDQFLQVQHNQLAIDHDKFQYCRDDYAKLLEQLNTTEQQVQQIVQNTDDQLEDTGYKTYRLCPSPIHGTGVFVEQPADPGFVIGIAKFGEKRMPLGRYTNHSPTPNAEMRQSVDGNIYLVATKYITGRQGGFQGDEVVIDYRKALELTQRITFEEEKQ